MYSGVTTNHLAELVVIDYPEHPGLHGLYQVVSEPITKHDLLCLFRETYQMDVQIVPDDLQVSDRSMKGDKLREAIGYRCPSWSILARQLAEDQLTVRKVGRVEMDKILEGKRVLITGGTGSLGKVLTRRILNGEVGHPAKVIIFSRDEAKQHFIRVEYGNRVAATDEIIYRNFQRLLEFRIGDIRNYGSVASVLRDADIVVNAAAMKQVPTCEYFPDEAVRTNVGGAENIVRAIQEHTLPVETVVGVSTDKACKPVNVMGMTKALQERIFVQANMRCPGTRFVCTRYGNVLASRGSVIPLFHEQIRSGGPVTITTPDMTRFLLTLDDAVDIIFAAIGEARHGETFVPRAPSARIADVATALIGGRPVAR